MKTYILILALLFTTNSGFTQELTQAQKLSSLCKVWGFLKYYHPEVTKGKWDWDSVLLRKIPLVEAANNKEELSKIYSDWLNELGDISKYPEQADVQTATPKNKYLQWLNDDAVFTKDLSAALENVRKRRNIGPNHYIDTHNMYAIFVNEKEYPDLTNADEGMRLLTLFRYWNMAEYFYPYKYLMDKNWDRSLEELIPEFYHAADMHAYHFAISKMIVHTNDAHATIHPPEFKKTFSHFAPFYTRVIGDKTVVTASRNDSLTELDDIKVGDVILAVNDTPIVDRINHIKPYIWSSNNASFLRNSSSFLLAGATGSVKITYERNGKRHDKVIHRCDNYRYWVWLPDPGKERFKILKGNIGYVNMGAMQELELHIFMEQMKRTDALILDVRNYPEGTVAGICAELSNNSRPFLTATLPNFSEPGAFRYNGADHIGHKNKKPYKGKIVILHNDFTQSFGEYTCMALKTLPNVTLIGSQTAGADGNISPIILPGGIKTAFSGVGIYYPDGGETQRIGIVPDIEVHPTIDGIRAGRDEVLERAIAFINTGK